ncbi:MAG: VanZ family protein [Bacteroidales bacterium]|jgi:VanZ family protein|nr:VanZ family protein [Bacteroidales bacterium]
MKNKKRFYFIGIIFWIVFMCVLLFAPSSAFSKTPSLFHIPNSDKIVHFIMFFVLSFLLYKNLLFIRHYPHKKISTIILSSIFLFGLLTETIQGLTFNILKRSFSLYDLLADVLAAIVVIIVFYFKNKEIKK